MKARKQRVEERHLRQNLVVNIEIVPLTVLPHSSCVQ
jgi:hypothetical protein